MLDDDVSPFSRHPNKEVAEAAIQEAITNVTEWSRCRKLTLNASKCEVAFFTNNSKEARWQPSLKLDEDLLNTTSLPSTGPFLSHRMSPLYFARPPTDVEYPPHLPTKCGTGGKINSSRSIGPFISVLSTTLPQPGNPGWPQPDWTSWNAVKTQHSSSSPDSSKPPVLGPTE